MNENKSLHTKVTWGGDSEIAGGNSWTGGIRTVYVIHYVKKGSGTLIVEDRTFKVSKGQSFLIYPGTYVKYFPDEEDPWEYVWIDFTGMVIKDILAGIEVSLENPVFPEHSKELAAFIPFSPIIPSITQSRPPFRKTIFLKQYLTI